MHKAILYVAALLALSSAYAAKEASPVEINDVETLNDNLNQYANKQVRVTGEVKDRIDARSIVLESGGIFNDEIVVIAGPNLKGDLAALTEDQQVRISGTLRQAEIIEVRREYSWDLDPQIEAELQGTRSYLVADQIQKVSK